MATGAISAVVLWLMVLFIGYEVVMRYGANAPTTWANEYSTYMLVAIAYLAAGYGLKTDSHIRVEVLISTLSEGTRQFLLLVTCWLSFFFVAVAFWQMIIFVHSDFIHDTRNWGLLRTLQWIPELPVAFGLGIFALTFLAEAFRLKTPSNSRRRWVPPIVIAISVPTLIWIGVRPIEIGFWRLDWGFLVLFMTALSATWAWSGLGVATTFGVLVAGLAASFYALNGSGVLAEGLALVATMLFLLLIGVRIAVALGLVGLFGVYALLPSPFLQVVAERAWTSINFFTFTAVPMFVLMGNLLIRSGVTTEMFDALTKWFGRVPGGLAHAGIGACGIFASVSGSSLATAATMGSIACPNMAARNYSNRLSYGAIAAGGTLGILIPPSIAMIVYGSTVGVAINELFIAGIIPGVILMLSMMAVVLAWALMVPGAAPAAASYGWGEKIRGTINIAPFAVLMSAILGSLYLGVATPTEAGAVGAILSAILCAIRGKLNWASLRDTALDTVRITSFILLIVVGASILTYVFDYLRIPAELVALVQAAGLDPWIVMALIALIYVVMGMFIDPISMMLMTLSVTFPIVVATGFDPIWFGVILVILIEIGLLTPPVGIILFVLKGMSDDVELREIVLGVIPFIFVMLLCLIFFTIFPGLITWLPSQMG